MLRHGEVPVGTLFLQPLRPPSWPATLVVCMSPAQSQVHIRLRASKAKAQSRIPLTHSPPPPLLHHFRFPDLSGTVLLFPFPSSLEVVDPFLPSLASSSTVSRFDLFFLRGLLAVEP